MVAVDVRRWIAHRCFDGVDRTDERSPRVSVELLPRPGVEFEGKGGGTTRQVVDERR